MSSTYNNIYDTNEQNKVVNKNGETTSFIYGDLNQRVQVVNAKSINSTTAYVSVNENNAVRVDVRRVPNKFTIYNENDGQVVYFDGSTAIQINLPEVITNIEYKVSSADNSPIIGFKKGEHYIDFTFGIGTHSQHTYVSLIAIQNLIDSVDQRVTEEVARATGAEGELDRKIDSNVTRLDGLISDEALARSQADVSLQGSIDTINSKIPNQASADNQLADKAFVNSSIQNMAAFYVTADAQGNPFATKQALLDSTQVYIDGVVTVPGVHDYCIVLADESKHEVSGDPTTRYIYQRENTQPYDSAGWAFQYIINNSGLTAEQLAAINSGITAQLVEDFSAKPDNNSFKTINNESIIKEPGGPTNIEIEGVTDYNELDNIPVLNRDLGNLEEEPVENTYYRHTGEDTHAVIRKFVEGQKVNSLIYDTSKSVEDMNDFFDAFVETATPFASDSHVTYYLFTVLESNGDEVYSPILLVIDQEAAEDAIGHAVDHDVYIVYNSTDVDDFSTAVAFINTYMQRTINVRLATWQEMISESGTYTFTYDTVGESWQLDGVDVDLADYGISGLVDGLETITVVYNSEEPNVSASCYPATKEAGWWTEEYVLPAELTVRTILNEGLEFFAGTLSSDVLQTGRIYVYKDGEFILGDYDEQTNIPIINADLLASNFTPEDGKYYRQTGTTITNAESFESGKYYNKCYLSQPKPDVVLEGFEYLDSNVDPDFITMLDTNNREVSVNYPYVDDFQRLGYQIKYGNDGKPIKYWVLASLPLGAPTPQTDKLHWAPRTVSSWSEFDTYNESDIVTLNDNYYRSLQDGNLNHDPESSVGYWQQIEITEWSETESYQVGDIVQRSSYFECVLDFTYNEQGLPVISSGTLFSLVMSSSDNRLVISYLGFIPMWGNQAESFGSVTLPAFTWINEENGLLPNREFLTLVSLENSYAEAKLFFRHQDVWNRWFSPKPFEKLELNKIFRKETNGLKGLLTEDYKELPKITEGGKFLQSSCIGYTMKFALDDSDNTYKFATIDDGEYPNLVFNTNIDENELRDCLTGLHEDVGGDLWHLTLNCGQMSSSGDMQDLYFVRDTSHKDTDNYDAFLIVGRLAQSSALIPIYTNYAQTYMVDSESVTVDETGWLIYANYIEFSSRASLVISYSAPNKIVDISTYGRIITTDVDTDYDNSYILFYGDTINAKAEWVDISIPEGAGVPDYSEANGEDVLKVFATAPVVAFVPEAEAGNTINGVYILQDSAPVLFDNCDTNTSYYGVYPATRALEVRVDGTVSGSSTTLYASVCLLTAHISGTTASLIYLTYRDSTSADDTFGGHWVFQYSADGGDIHTEWHDSAITQEGNFIEIIKNFISELGFDSGYTLTVESTFEQDKWRSWMGISKTVEEVVPASKSIGWGSPYPEIKKAGQVLTSSCETYSFDFVRNSSNDYRCSVDSSGRLYFNTELSDEDVESTLAVFLINYGGSQSFKQWMFWAKDSSDTRILPYWGFISGDNNACAIVAIDSQGIHQIWANIDGDFTINGQSVQLTCHVGWDLENIETYSSWTGASYLQYTSPNSLISPSDYGTILSLQDGIFYGDVKNAKVEWKDLNISPNLSEVNVDYDNITNYDSTSTQPARLFGQYNTNSDRITGWGANSIRGWLGVRSNINSTFTVYSKGWNSSNDEYYTTVTISNLTDSDALIVVPNSQTDAKNAQSANIYYAYSSGTTLYMYCTSQPENDIAFKYTIVKSQA